MARQKPGIQIREGKRDKLEERRCLLACKLIDKHIDLAKIADSEDKQRLFDLMWLKFDTDLSANKHFKDVKKYSTAYNHAIKYCQSRIENANIDIGFPKLIIQSSRAKSFRTQKWFNDGKRVLDFYLNWVKSLETKKAVDITLSDILFTLIFHSAILKAPVLQEILDQIIEKRISLEQVSGLPTITVIVNDDTYHTNTYKESKAVHQAQVFISPLSAHIIQSYIKEQENAIIDRDKNFTIYKRYQSIQLSQANQGNDVEFGLKRFLMGAIYVLENYFNFSLPEHTWYIVTGEEDTYSLATSNWQSIIYDIQHGTSNHKEELNCRISSIANNSSKKKNHKLAVEIAKLFKSDENAKVAKKIFVEQLEHLNKKLENNYTPLNEKAIVGWLLSKTSNCEVSSIQTYSNRITNRWLALTQDVDLEHYQEEDFVALYNEMIELSKTKKAKNKAATLINEVHQYIVDHYHVESIAPLATGNRAHHRVGYISENMFQALLIKINGLIMTVDEKQALSLALILGHRCGLRIGEIIKIRIRDVAETQNYLEIRNNKFGNNKSLSARRRVLLAQLLTDSDIKLIERVYIKRSAYESQTLIANQAGLPYTAQAISKILSGLIKEVTGLSYLTTHHLRHSCLTNFQLMSFLYDKDYQFDNQPSVKFLKSLLPYKDDQAVDIINQFQTNLAYKKIFALAGVAGHANPSTTFASYVHFTDIQIGLLLWQTNFMLSIRHAQLLKIPRRRKSKIERDPLETNEYLMHKLKLPELPQPKSSNAVSDNLAEETNSTKKYAFDEVHQILEAYAEKSDYEYLMRVYDVSQDTFEKWYYNAQQLREASKFQTTKGNPRLFDSNNNNGLLPIKDRYGDDRKNMIRMTDKFRDVYQGSNDKSAINKFVLHTLINAQPRKNFIIFKHATDLYNYLEIVCQLVYKKDISLKVYNYEHATKADQDSWNAALKTISRSQIEFTELNYIKGKSYQKQIRAELSLTSQTQPIRIELC